MAELAIVDLAMAKLRLAVSIDFETYLPITDVAQLVELRALDKEARSYAEQRRRPRPPRSRSSEKRVAP